MRRIITEYAIAAIAAGAAAFIKDHFFLESGQQAQAYAVSVLGGLATFVLLHLLRFLLSRMLVVDPRLRVLGRWIEDIHKGEAFHYSIFEIRSGLFGDVIYVSGRTYDASTHEEYANWGSLAASFPDEATLYYLHQAVVGDAHVSGVTRLSFAGHGRVFEEGSGYLIDNTHPLEKVTFSFERLRRRDIKRILGKNKIATKDDRVQFIDHWRKERNGKSHGN